MQRNRRFDAGDDIFLKRAAHPHQAFIPAGAVHDQLGDETVIGSAAPCSPDRARCRMRTPSPPGRMVAGDPARRGQEGFGVLGVYAACRWHGRGGSTFLAQLELTASRDADLLAHDVDCR